MKKSTKIVSIILVIVMVISAIPFFSFAANPSLTASASKTTDIKAGDEVTVTVKLSKDSGLGTLIVELNYDGAAFKVESATAGTLFGNDFVNSGLTNKVKFVAASTNVVNAEGTVFTVKFKALKAADSTMTLKIAEATDDDYNNVTVTTNTLSFKGYVEPSSEAPSEKPSETPSEKPSETPSEKPSETPSEKPSEPEDPCKDGHDYNKALVVKAPTCKDAGVSQKTCKVCGDKIEEAIPATGVCEPGSWIVTKQPTTTVNGEKVQKCKYCGDVLQRAKIDKLPSDPTEPSVPSDENENNDFFIKEPSRTTIRNRDGIILHVNPQFSMPKGSYIVWKYKNSNFDVEEADNGMKLIATAKNKGWTVFTATLYDVDGNVLATDSVELYSKSGLFDKVSGFFRKIFGATKIYEN